MVQQLLFSKFFLKISESVWTKVFENKLKVAENWRRNFPKVIKNPDVRNHCLKNFNTGNNLNYPGIIHKLVIHVNIEILMSVMVYLTVVNLACTYSRLSLLLFLFLYFLSEKILSLIFFRKHTYVYKLFCFTLSF